MRRIGVTQRVEVVAEHGERRDCLDQRWFALLEHLGLSAVPLPNSLEAPEAHLRALGLEGVILTGGNDLATLPDASRPAPERDATEYRLLDFAAAARLPILGVCRGLQVLNVYLGGRLVPVTGHAGTRHGIVSQDTEPTFVAHNVVNSYHNWGIAAEDLATDLCAAVKAHDGTIEAAHHRALPWLGIMWHPERETPFLDADLTLIRQLFGTDS